MQWFARKQHDRIMWLSVGVMALALIEGYAAGQCLVIDKLLASDGAMSDRFGFSVSISGAPGNEVAIVGAGNDEDNGTNSGSAYIYRFNGVVWVEEQKLLASDGAMSDAFGGSVSISGNPGNEVAIVGATGHDDNGLDAGSAYVYRFNGTIWVQEAKLLASDGAAGDWFGISVSISGTAGNEVAIIGARFRDDNGSDSGSAYIYRFNGVSWVEEQKLLASDGAAGDAFGVSVSIHSAPGIEVAIVGAYLDDDNGSDSGSAYIYRKSGATWVEEQRLLDIFGLNSDNFGQSVSISGTPGNEVAIIGVPGNDYNGLDSGLAYIYRFNGSTWVEEVFFADSASVDNFGYSVSISSTPGNETAIVGAYGTGVITGKAFLYRSDGVSWNLDDVLRADDGATSDFFGWSVSISGDIALVGADGHDDNGTNSGSAYVFSPPDCNANGINDCQDIVAGTSNDINGNDVPDECEAFALNLTQGTEHPTISGAIAAAFDGDRIHATIPAFQVFGNIDFSSKAITLTSAADLTVQTLEMFTLADDSSLESAPGAAMLIEGNLIVPVGDQAGLVGSPIFIDVKGRMTLNASSILEIVSAGTLKSVGRVDFFGATLSSPNGFLNAGIVSGFGILSAPFTNDGNAIFIADSQVIGDYTNNVTTTIQNGTLTIIGTFLNNGTIIGDVGPAAAKATGANATGPPTGLFVSGTYSASAAASLVVPSADHFVKVGGDFDVAINDNNRFDMVLAELRLVGLGAGTQSLELMSEDIGENSEGLDRSFPGHYPIGTLRIGPTPTTVTLVDNHDNDKLGQTQCEAIYVRDLIIDAGATLNTNGCRVYYETLVANGLVDDRRNLIALPLCLADFNDDNSVNVTDLLLLLGGWGPNPGHAADINGDGNVNVTDLLALLAAWGVCP